MPLHLNFKKSINWNNKYIHFIKATNKMVSGFTLFFALFNNIAIFIALISLYGYLYSVTVALKLIQRQIITGFCFGIFAIGCMYARIPVFEGVIVDQRNAIVTLSAAFGGPLSGFLSAILAGSFRAYIGGEGVFGGIIGVTLAATAGSILYFLKNSFEKLTTAAVRSLISVIIILPGFLFIGDLKLGWNLMLNMSIPYGTAIFMGILFGGLLINREEIRSDIKKSLKINEEKYRVLFESFPLGITITDKNGNIIETNNIAEDMLEIDREEHNKRTIFSPEWKLLKPDGSPMDPTDYPGLWALKENRKIENTEIGFDRADGKRMWLNTTVTPIPLHDYGIAIIYNDISERKMFESSLKKALEEKTVLLQEVYHRTKNNMQMIIAILALQGAYIKDKKLEAILSETQDRIHSMALVHEKLYQSQDLLNINLSEYVRDLVSLLVNSFQITAKQVKINYNMDDVLIKIDTAIPAGLLLQELISNVFKHAFPKGQKGSLFIEIKKNTDGTINLVVADNGIGLPQSIDIRKSVKFGISTIIALGEQQLNGTVKFETNKGVKCSITFKHSKHMEKMTF